MCPTDVLACLLDSWPSLHPAFLISFQLHTPSAAPPPRRDTVRAVERQGTEGIGDGRFHALLGGYKTIAENGLFGL